MGKTATFNGFTQEHFDKVLDIFIKYDNKCRFVFDFEGSYYLFKQSKKHPLAAWRINPNIFKNIYFHFVNTANLHIFLGRILLRNLLPIFEAFFGLRLFMEITQDELLCDL